ncbi:MAG TPA: SGNH/GDSL hydrolase family protein [Thermoanaerobaculia bacterium]|jgi:lysophospholipase L1-like esterase
MKKNTIAFFGFALAVSLLAAPLRAQTFQKYVALGDSLTAGWQSGCLVQRNQQMSYPAVLAQTLGVADFQQPLVQEIALTDPPTTACLGAVLSGTSITVAPVSEMGQPLNALLGRPYDNLGVPGFEVADVTEFKHSNPVGDSEDQIAALVLRNFPGSPFDGTSAVDQANLLLGPAGTPTLVTLWIGSNDVLGAATSGIVVDGVTLTTAADFDARYKAITAALLPSTRFVAVNITDVTTIPFATTIPPVLVDPATMQPVLVGGLPVPLLGEGDAAFPCTPTPPDQGCPLPQGTLVLLPASSMLAAGIGIPRAAGGSGLPLPHGHIDATGPHAGVTLYPDEIQLLQSRTNEYNASIASSIGNEQLWDAHSFFAAVKAAGGYEIGGITVTTDYLKGGLFSYDGVHPSNIGYVIVADQIIATLNSSGSVVYPRPNFSPALFTPNVPQPAGAAVEDGGAWHYRFATWKSVLASFGVDAALPQRPAADRTPPRLARPTRTVGRPAAAE